MTRPACGVRTACVGFALVCVVALVAPASAAVIHSALTPPITEVPASSGAPLTGALSNVHAITVDSGDLYVADGSGEHSRLDRFDASSGAFVSQFAQVPSLSYLDQGLAVGHATGEKEVYVAGDESVAGSPEGVVSVFGAAGGLQAVWRGADTPGNAFGCFECAGPADVAVDNSTGPADWAAGDVYVSVPVDGVVDVFSPEAKGKERYVTQLTGTCALSGSCLEAIPFSDPTGVAVSAFDGEVLVVDRKSVVDIFKPAAVPGRYEFVEALTGTPAGAFAEIESVTVDGGDGDIYVADRGSVDEFSSAGVYLGWIEGAATPRSVIDIVPSLAVDPATHHVYLGVERSEEGVVGVVGSVGVRGANVVVPDVTPGPPSNIGAESATLSGTVNADGEGPATCRFVWGTTTEFGRTVECSAPVAEGSTGVAVGATLSGLQPDSGYCYRLQATGKNGTNPGEPWQDRCFTTRGPGIHKAWASDVASTSATLHAAIDPHAAPTSYYFQYGMSTDYGSEAPVSPGTAIGSGEGEVNVAPQRLQGLRASTVYHYRVVAVSELAPHDHEAFYAPDRTFTTQRASGGPVLADARAWEMVSPPSIEVAGRSGLAQASAHGSAITYLADAPIEAKPQASASLVQVLSGRGPGGWRSRDITVAGNATAGQIQEASEYRFFSQDLSLGVVQPFGSFISKASPQALAPREASEQTAFLRTAFRHGDVGDRCTAACYRPLVTGAPGHANVPPGTAFGEAGACPPAAICGPRFLAATPNLNHIVLASDVALTSKPAGKGSLYEWTGGKLTLVSVLPGGASASNPALEESEDTSRHAISDDGSRVVWSNAGQHLYLRDSARRETIQLDAVQGGTGSGVAAPRLQIASSDASKVFFLDPRRLVKNSGGSEFIGGGDLYECEMIEVAGRLRCRLSDLTPLNDGEHAGVEGVLGASNDGSWVYFVANNVLAPGAVRGTCQGHFAPPEAICNLYARHDGTTRLVAVLLHADSPDWGAAGLSALTARVSPDGRWLAFMSQRELTGNDTLDAVSGKPDEEVYLYDASSGRLVCASCNPAGARPVGVEYKHLAGGLVAGGALMESQWLAANIPGWSAYTQGHALYQSRYLSDSGRLFFNSSDALVPWDVNGTWDVYEYEPAGVGDCTSSSVTFSERSGGCVGLISSGRSSAESAFLDASENGGDVFFLTAARLVPKDVVDGLDVYDAHECAGAPSCPSVPIVQPPPCGKGGLCEPVTVLQPEVFGWSMTARSLGG